MNIYELLLILILHSLYIMIIITPKHSQLPLLISPTNSTRHSVQITESHKKDNQIRQLTQKLNRNLSLLLSQQRKQQFNVNNNNLSRVITAITTDVTRRSLDDVAVLYWFLSQTSFINKFKEDDVDVLNYDKMFIILATYATYVHVVNNNIIYDFNMNAKYSYVIAQGEVALYTPHKEIKELTGYEYYSVLMDMLDNDNAALVEVTVKDNEKVYNVNVDDIELLKLILLKLEYTLYKKNKSKCNNSNHIQESFFNKLHINPNDIGINCETMSQIAIDDKINVLVRNVPSDFCERYAFISDNNIKHNVNVFVYGNEPTMICKEGDCIGKSKVYNNSNSSNNSIKVYSDKAISIGETYLIAMNNYIYNEYIELENENMKMKELSFLYDNFFFKYIVKRKFEREYFPLFTKGIFKKHNILYKENEPLRYIYFIQEGSIVLTLNKSIIETHAMIRILQSYVKVIKEGEHNNANDNDDALYYDEDFPFLAHLPSQMANELTQKQKRNVIINSNKEILGIESLYGGWNYLLSAKVSSDVCSVYKIAVDDLVNIFNKEEISVYDDFVKRSRLKIQMILKRLLNVNKASMQIVDRQICGYNNPVVNNDDEHHNEVNRLFTIESKKKRSNNNNNNNNNKSVSHKKGFSFLSLSQEGVNSNAHKHKHQHQTKHFSYNKYCTSSTNISSINNNHNNTSTNDMFSKRKVSFRNKQINKILSLNDISNNIFNNNNNKHAFEERMLIRAKRGLRLSQKHLISQIDTTSSIISPIETNNNMNINNNNNNNNETTSPFLTTVHSKKSNKHSNTKKTFSVSIEHKTNNTSMNSTLKHTQTFKTPITKAKIKKYSVFDNGLDYFDFEGDYKHFKHIKKKQLNHYDSTNYNNNINKTFKNLNTLSLHHIDGNINRMKYNFKLKQLNILNTLKQSKNITYKHLIAKQIYSKLNPLIKK